MENRSSLQLLQYELCLRIEAFDASNVTDIIPRQPNDSFTAGIYPTIPTIQAPTESGDDVHETIFSEGQYNLQHIQRVFYTRVAPAICALGLIGNVLNLMVLMPKGSRRCAMGRIEKFAYSGLTALALSDILFCLTVIPSAFVGPGNLHDRITFSLLYSVYSNALTNTFMTSSTWMTVSLAVGRYLAICHPLRAREIIGMTIARRSLVAIFTVSVLFNCPRFWTYRILSVTCGDTLTVYFPHHGVLKEGVRYWNMYQWMYFTLGIALPLVLMFFCNAHLIRALYMSRRTRTSLRVQSATSHSISGATRHITRTLIAIIVMYLILVTPAELITFFRPDNSQPADIYNLVIAVVNSFQAINFSFSFILYCVINVHFRQSVVDVMSCNYACADAQRSSDMTYSNVQSTALTTQNGAIELG